MFSVYNKTLLYILSCIYTNWKIHFYLFHSKYRPPPPFFHLSARERKREKSERTFGRYNHIFLLSEKAVIRRKNYKKGCCVRNPSVESLLSIKAGVLLFALWQWWKCVCVCSINSPIIEYSVGLIHCLLSIKIIGFYGFFVLSRCKPVESLLHQFFRAYYYSNPVY